MKDYPYPSSLFIFLIGNRNEYRTDRVPSGPPFLHLSARLISIALIGVERDERYPSVKKGVSGRRFGCAMISSEKRLSQRRPGMHVRAVAGRATDGR